MENVNHHVNDWCYVDKFKDLNNKTCKISSKNWSVKI